MSDTPPWGELPSIEPNDRVGVEINGQVYTGPAAEMLPDTDILAEIRFGPLVAETNEKWQYPTRSHADDAGWDLYTSERVVIPPNEFRDLPTNIWVALPANLWGLVTGRSSALRQHGLLVHSGVIDAGYRGELFAGAFNLANRQVIIEPGQRLAQFIPIPRSAIPVEMVLSDPPPGTRGTAGFGSTGR